MVTLSASSQALAWKPKTHLFTAAAAVEEILAGSNSVTINGKPYMVNKHVANAIRTFPDYYFGGVVGPDAFPDIVFGQSFIHPDVRCKNGNLSGDDCNFGAGASFTDDWLQLIYWEGWNYYSYCSGFGGTPTTCVDSELPGAVLAFTYGFLTHAAGDMWGHTFVNEFAGGAWPDLASGDRSIAIRHIIVEGYVGSHTPGGPSGLGSLVGLGPGKVEELNAPPHFIYETFIKSERAKKLTSESHFDLFLTLKEDKLPELESNPAVQLIPFSGTYIGDWKDYIDDGLKAWPVMSLDVANELFFIDGPDATQHALDRVEEFKNEHLLSMLFGPAGDFVGSLLGIADDFLDYLKSIQDLLSDFQNWLIKEATGIDIEKWKLYIKSPETYINQNSTPVDLPTDTSQRLDDLMGITHGVDNPHTPFDIEQFAAAKNTVVLSRLLLLDAAELNTLLHDHHVGAIYDEHGTWNNAILGFIGTLDGNHQWRDHAPAWAASGPKRFSTSIEDMPQLISGMPLWKDCLARDRVFRKIFTDWQNNGENFPELDNRENSPELDKDCEQISDPLPPVEFNLTPEQEQLSEPVCFGRTFTAELINHKKEEQSFALYLRVTDSFGDIVNHSVNLGILDEFETQTYSMTVPGSGCQGIYTVTGYLFERMWSLVLDDQEANPPIRPTELLTADVNSPQGRSIVIKDPKLCPVCLLSCPKNPPNQQPTPIVPGGSQLPCPPTPAVCTACDSSFPIRRLLDADHDGILDGGLRGQPGDNCPTVPNSDQADTDANGVGDICELLRARIPVGKNDIAVLLEQIDNARYAEIMWLLFSEPDFPGPLGPWCPMGITCPEVFDELSTSVRAFTKAFDKDQVSPGVYASTMRDIVKGPSIRTDTTEVLRVSLDGSSNAMVFAIRATADDTMTVRLPRVLLDAKINDEVADLVVLVNGSIRHSTETLSANYRVLEIPLRAGDSDVSIRGTQLGPQVDEQASALSDETMRALVFVAVVITLIIGFFTVRYLRKRDRLVAARVAQLTTETPLSEEHDSLQK